MKKLLPIPKGLLTTEQLLLAGGDIRLKLDPLSGLNKYGCGPVPDSTLLAFGSSTASVISAEGFAAADKLRQRLLTAISKASPTAVYAAEIQRIHLEWRDLCELSGFDGLELILSPSGTDIHSIATRYASGTAAAPALAVMVEANETGSGVLSALKQQTASGANCAEVVQVAIRLGDGSLRPMADVDAEVDVLVSQAVAAGRRVLLILVDQTKTGLIAPSPACVMALKQRYPEHMEVLVDACQFRIAIPTLQAYLQQGFMVALTGSKFLAGPSFSAVLMLPASLSRHRQQMLADGVLSSAADQKTRVDRRKPVANFGLLLRFEAALEELRRFRAASPAAITAFVQTFAATLQRRLNADPHFEPLAVPQLDRRPLIVDENWDHVQTIFPFLLYSLEPASGRKLLNHAEIVNIYKRLPMALDCPESATVRCQLGQPVACGTRDGVAVYALRLCLSARLIVEAARREDKGVGIIGDALRALDKTALLIQLSELEGESEAGISRKAA